MVNGEPSEQGVEICTRIGTTESDKRMTTEVYRRSSEDDSREPGKPSDDERRDGSKECGVKANDVEGRADKRFVVVCKREERRRKGRQIIKNGNQRNRGRRRAIAKYTSPNHSGEQDRGAHDDQQRGEYTRAGRDNVPSHVQQSTRDVGGGGIWRRGRRRGKAG